MVIFRFLFSSRPVCYYNDKYLSILVDRRQIGAAYWDIYVQVIGAMRAAELHATCERTSKLVEHIHSRWVKSFISIPFTQFIYIDEDGDLLNSELIIGLTSSDGWWRTTPV